MINWTEVYRDVFRTPDLVLVDPIQGGAKPCRIIPCPGSYFPAHDEQCEMSWDEEDFVYTDCQCEPRARVHTEQEGTWQS